MYGDVEYKVGVEDASFLPYSDVKNKEYRGILKDILSAFAAKKKIKMAFLPLPISRLYADFYNGKLDFKMPANEYWQKELKDKRGLKIFYSKPLVAYRDGVMVPKENLGRGTKSLKTLGVVAGFTPRDYLFLIKKKAIFVRENPSIQGLLQQGILGRVDGIYINISVGEYYLREFLKKEGILVFDQDLPYTESGYSVATLKHEKLIEDLNQFLVTEQEMLTDLKKRYFILPLK